MARKSNNAPDLDTVVTRLRELRLSTMADQLLMMDANNELEKRSALSVLDVLTSEEQIGRDNRTAESHIKKARVVIPEADLAEIKYLPERHLNRPLIERLSTNDYIRDGRNVFVLAATGCGKSFFASALAKNACRSLHSAAYFYMDDFIRECRRNDDMNALPEYLHKVSLNDLIILDDFLLTSITMKDMEYIYKLLIEKPRKNRSRSFIICSQLMKEEMYTRMAEQSKALGDTILNRLSAKSYELIIEGPSMRDTL